MLHLNVAVANVGKIAVPDPYFREGATVFDLKNEEWNDCIWEFPSMGRDEITELTFYVYLSGQAVAWDDRLVYDLKDIAPSGQCFAVRAASSLRTLPSFVSATHTLPSFLASGVYASLSPHQRFFLSVTFFFGNSASRLFSLCRGRDW